MSGKRRNITNGNIEFNVCDFDDNSTACDPLIDSKNEIQHLKTMTPKFSIFECDFRNQVRESLERVVGIIDAVKSVEVNNIRQITSCGLSRSDGEDEIRQYLDIIGEKEVNDVNFNALMNSKEKLIQKKTKFHQPCFVIEYSIQV